MRKLVMSILGSIMWTCLSFVKVMAVNYYLSSANGSDSNNGLSISTPWKTINKLNTKIFQPGDSILFKRGDIFRGQIGGNLGFNYDGTVSNPIVFGAYGEGAHPIISGSELVSTWTNTSLAGKSDVYVANISKQVSNLFVNGNQMTLARHPNTGWLAIDAENGNKGFKDAALTQATDYWKEANVRIRTSDWSYEITQVASFTSGGTILFSNPTKYSTANGWGYYLDNKLEALDAPGEWYYDPYQSKLYLKTPTGVNPSNLKVEASVFAFGFKGNWNKKGIIIKDLEISQQTRDGISIEGATSADNKILNNIIRQQLNNGVSYMGTNIVIEGNTFENIMGRAITSNTPVNSKIIKNKIRKIGTFPAFNAVGGNYQGAGIYVDRATNCIISQNIVDTVGAAGIACNGSFCIIEKNIVRNACTTINDNAGMYCFDTYSNNSIWRNNFVYNCVGYGGGHPQNKLEAIGIYFDNFVNNSVIESNTVADCGTGILINSDAYNNKIRNNTSYNNHKEQFLFAEWKTQGATKNNRLSRNVLYSLSSSQTCVGFYSNWTTFNFGTYDSNYYYNPYSVNVLKRGKFTAAASYTFEQFKSFYTTENLNSKKCIFTGSSTENPKSKSALFTNETNQASMLNLCGATWVDLDNKPINSVITLSPFSSMVLIKTGTVNSPTVNITSPSDQSTTTSGSILNIQTSVNGVVSKVEFYNSGVKIGEDLSFPFSYNWTNPPRGTNYISALAYDGNNKTCVASSGTVKVTVEGTTMISDLQDDLSAFQIFPNPASEYFNVQFNNLFQEKVELMVYNNLMEVVSIYDVNTLTDGGSFKVSTRNFNSGLYYLFLKTGNEKFVRKLTITK